MQKGCGVKQVTVEDNRAPDSRAPDGRVPDSPPSVAFLNNPCEQRHLCGTQNPARLPMTTSNRRDAILL